MKSALIVAIILVGVLGSYTAYDITDSLLVVDQTTINNPPVVDTESPKEPPTNLPTDPSIKPIIDPDPVVVTPPVAPALPSGILSVVDVTDNKEAYVNQKISVRGMVYVNVFHGAFPCHIDEETCDTSMGAQLELRQEPVALGKENLILLFKGEEQYPCEKIAPATYKCASYTSEETEIDVVAGVWIKYQKPIMWVGSSGGGAPKAVKWEDGYYLDIE